MRPCVIEQLRSFVFWRRCPMRCRQRGRCPFGSAFIPLLARTALNRVLYPCPDSFPVVGCWQDFWASGDNAERVLTLGTWRLRGTVNSCQDFGTCHVTVCFTGAQVPQCSLGQSLTCRVLWPLCWRLGDTVLIKNLLAIASQLFSTESRAGWCLPSDLAYPKNVFFG